MRTEDFDYHLPSDLIAQRPLKERDACRLLVLDKATGAIRHTIFRDLPGLLKPHDRLVFNDTRVLPARLFCRKQSGGTVELLFTGPLGGGAWKALAKPSRRLRPGTVLSVDGDPAAPSLRIDGGGSEGEWVIRLADRNGFDSIAGIIERYGRMPLPPYIKRAVDDQDATTYQTVYAAHPGAIAAPTAGLHFTPQLFTELGIRGVATTFVTLHVGRGTFLPVKVSDPRDHVMHEEEYMLSPGAAGEIVRTKKEGGRVIAVGTTVVRILEHCSPAPGALNPSQGRTGLKILQPYEFKIVDGLITNFHLPKSTLLMLVCAFAGKKSITDAYTEAIRLKYRFFSYGDAMFVI